MAFLQTVAANTGQTWEQKLAQCIPAVDENGFVNGPWGECMHYAVVFELTNSSWAEMEEYQEGGPCAQVAECLVQKGFKFAENALMKNEETTRERIAQGNGAFVFQTPAPMASPRPAKASHTFTPSPQVPDSRQSFAGLTVVSAEGPSPMQLQSTSTHRNTALPTWNPIAPQLQQQQQARALAGSNLQQASAPAGSSKAAPQNRSSAMPSRASAVPFGQAQSLQPWEAAQLQQVNLQNTVTVMGQNLQVVNHGPSVVQGMDHRTGPMPSLYDQNLDHRGPMPSLYNRDSSVSVVGANGQMMQGHGHGSIVFNSVPSNMMPWQCTPSQGHGGSQVIQGQALPHHPGATGTVPVVGLPLNERFEEAKRMNRLPRECSIETVEKGMSVLDAHPLMPEVRPWRDVFFGVCFIFTALAMLGTAVAGVGYIPGFVMRTSTLWEAYPGQACGDGLIVMSSWPPTGVTTQVEGVQQRMSEGNGTTARRLFEDDGLRSFGVEEAPWEQYSLRQPHLQLPGLSDLVFRLKFVGMNPGTQLIPITRFEKPVPLSGFTEVLTALNRFRQGDDDDIDFSVESRRLETDPVAGRRRRAAQSAAEDRDCERSCAAYKECAAFEVEKFTVVVGEDIDSDVSLGPMGNGKTGGDGAASPALGPGETTTEMQPDVRTSFTCTYYSKPDGMETMPMGVATMEDRMVTCWHKVDPENAIAQSTEFVGHLAGYTVLGSMMSVFVGMGLVKFASVNPATATYFGIYGIPGAMIAFGMLLALLLPGAFALTVGLVFMCMGSCVMACVCFCWRDLIPLTIEVIDASAKVVARYWSMVGISVCGTLAGLAWSFTLGTAGLGLYALYDEGRVHVPQASQASNSSAAEDVIYFLVCLIFGWGFYTVSNLSHTAYCGVFGRWYFEGEDKLKDSKPVTDSLKIACTKSFGSVAFGSLIIAVIRAMEKLLRKMSHDAGEDGNMVMCIIFCVLSVLVSCLGDLVEWISNYIYVQVALRGLSFINGASATYSLATISNLVFVASAVLVEYVTLLGAIFCGIAGSLVAGGVAYVSCGLPGACGTLAAMAGLFGCCGGCIAGGSAVGILNSGSVSILMCWAERPDVLKATHEKIATRFEEVTQQAM